MVKLLLVGCPPLVSKVLRMRLELEPDFVVVGEAGDGVEALALASERTPDVVVVDAEMAHVGGYRAASELVAGGVRCGFVVLSIHDDPAIHLAAPGVGVSAFVSKSEPFAALTDAVRDAARANDQDGSHARD